MSLSVQTVPSLAETSFSEAAPSRPRSKPILPPPQTGAFALHYIMTKMGIGSDSMAAAAYKKEMELLDADTQEVYRERLQEMAATLKQEASVRRWDVATKVFAWMTTFSGLMTGIVMIATGVGAIAGGLILAGSAVQLSNQVMEETHGWAKLADKIPGETNEIKKARLTLIQMGVAGVSILTAAAGAFTGGLSNAYTAYNTAGQFTNCALNTGSGVTAIGSSITQADHQKKLGKLAHFNLQLTLLKQIRKDLLNKFEGSVDQLEKLFQSLNRSLDLEREQFLADQMIYRG